MNAGRSRIPRSLVPTAALALLSLLLLVLPATSLGAGPEGRLTPTSRNYGQVIPGESTAPFSFFLESTGTEPLIVQKEPVIGGTGKAAYVISTPGAFSCQEGTTLKLGQSCGISVSFKPPAMGSYEATLGVVTNAGVSESKLLGEGAGPEATMTPLEFKFGQIAVGKESSAAKFVLANVSPSVPLEIKESSIFFSEEFKIVSNTCPSVLKPAEECVISVVFAPQSAGEKSAALLVAYVGGSTGAELRGEGVVPGLEISPPGWNFGEQKVGTKTTRTFEVTNPGAAPVMLGSAVLEGPSLGDFSIPGGSCLATGFLPAGGSCTLEVTFEPGSVGKKSAQLSMYSVLGVTTVPLEGTGV